MQNSNILDLKRRDFAVNAAISMKEVATPLWNHLRSVPADQVQQNPIYLKPNTGFGRLVKTDEGNPNPTQIQLPLPQLTITQYRYGMKYIHTIEAQVFDPYGKFAEAGREMGKAKPRTHEQLAANVFNNGFDATNYPIATGKALFDDDHVLADYTHDNLMTAEALSESALESARTMLYNQKDPRNEPNAYMGGLLLVVPPALKQEAEKIIGTVKQLGTNNNDINVARENITIVCSPRLTSSTAWFLLPSDSSEHYIWKAVAVDSQTATDRDEDGNVKSALWTFVGTGAENGLNTIGNAGA